MRDKPINSSYNWVLKNNLFPLNKTIAKDPFTYIGMINIYKVDISQQTHNKVKPLILYTIERYLLIEVYRKSKHLIGILEVTKKKKII